MEQMLPEARFRSIIVPRNASPATISEHYHQCKSTKPLILWLNVQDEPKTLDNRAEKRLKQLLSLAQQQLFHQRWLNIEAPFGAITDFIHQQLHELDHFHTTFKWCNLGIQHPQNHRPIGTTTTIIGNWRMPDAQQCTCGKPYGEHIKVGHRYNDSMDANNRDMVNRAAQTMQAATLLGSIAAEHSRPFGNTMDVMQDIMAYLDTQKLKPHRNLSEPQLNKLHLHTFATTKPRKQLTFATEQTTISYPTENRMRQKAKEKELKDAGQEIVKKKRIKPCLKGTDDLGEDISAIDFGNDEPEAYFDYGLSSRYNEE